MSIRIDLSKSIFKEMIEKLPFGVSALVLFSLVTFTVGCNKDYERVSSEVRYSYDSRITDTTLYILETSSNGIVELYLNGVGDTVLMRKCSGKECEYIQGSYVTLVRLVAVGLNAVIEVFFVPDYKCGVNPEVEMVLLDGNGNTVAKHDSFTIYDNMTTGVDYNFDEPGVYYWHMSTSIYDECTDILYLG